ncbi:MAG: glycosyltransferase family 39 protein [Caldilineaceae bacterium]
MNAAPIRWLGRHRISLVPLLVITLVGALLRFYAIGAKTLWLDEAFSLWLAHHTLIDLWSWLIRIDQHPPLYYSLLHGWLALVGDWQGPVRALSALCSVLTLPIFFAFCRHLSDRPTALWATGLLAISPFHVHYAQETRMYALLTLLVAMALFCVVTILFDERARQQRWPWVGLALSEAAVMLTHNTATIFFPLALNLAIGGAVLWQYTRGGVSSLPALNDEHFERRWVRTQLGAVIGWLPWSVPFLIQAAMVDREFWISAPSWGVVLETLHNFNLAFEPAWSPLATATDGSLWLLALLGLWSLRRTPARAMLLLLLFLTPILGELLVSLRRPIFSERTLIWATLAYYLLVAQGLWWFATRVAAWLKRNQSLSAASASASAWPTVIVPSVLIGALLAANAIALSNYYFYFTKEDWAKAAAYVAHHAQPGDLLLFNATWVQLPFDYYFQRYGVAADLHGLPVDLFDRDVLEPKMTVADLPYMRTLIASRPRIWLIYSHDWYTDPQGIIPRELQRQRRLVDRQRLEGLQLFYFEQ